MSEYVIAQKQDLINIADAIREKTETTDGMGIDEMAALIAAIESGGKLATGKFSSSNSSPATALITHDLGDIPNFCIVATNDQDIFNSTSMATILVSLIFIKNSDTTVYGLETNVTGGTIYCEYGECNIEATTKPAVPGAYNATETEITLAPFDGIFARGVEYTWILGVI